MRGEGGIIFTHSFDIFIRSSNFPVVQRELFPTSPNKGEQARRKLLLAALKKFGEKGYENASVREIADEAGQDVAAISYYVIGLIGYSALFVLGGLLSVLGALAVAPIRSVR